MAAVGTTDVYLRRSAPDRWQLAAAVHHSSSGEWRAEYANFEDGLPRAIRLASADGKRFDLRLALSQVELNVRFGPEVFRIQIPRDAEPITIEELKRSGPLGSPTGSTHLFGSLCPLC